MEVREGKDTCYLSFHFIKSSEVLLLLAVLVYVEAFLNYIAILMLNWHTCHPDIGMFYVHFVLPYGNVRLSI